MQTVERRPNSHRENFRSIAVFRALQLGDMLCAVPALRALRCAFPGSRITLIGLPWASTFVERFNHYVDDFIDFPGWPGLPERELEIEAVPAFLATMHARRFDVAVQMHGDGTLTNRVVALFGAGLVVGACADHAWRPERAMFTEYPTDLPERGRALRAVERLGVSGASDVLEFPILPGDRDALRDVYTVDPPTVVIHPGARAAARRWPASYFAAVADGLVEAGASVAITGSSSERPLAEDVASAMRRPATVLAGQTSLGVLAALIESSTLVVCNDTGISHLADALATRSVVLLTGSDPNRWAPRDPTLHHALTYPLTLDPACVLAHGLALFDAEPACVS